MQSEFVWDDQSWSSVVEARALRMVSACSSCSVCFIFHLSPILRWLLFAIYKKCKESSIDWLRHVFHLFGFVATNRNPSRKPTASALATRNVLVGAPKEAVGQWRSSMATTPNLWKIINFEWIYCTTDPTTPVLVSCFGTKMPRTTTALSWPMVVPAWFECWTGCKPKFPAITGPVVAGTWSLCCTCWWYSLCNFQYRSLYKNTCSNNFDSWSHTNICFCIFILCLYTMTSMINTNPFFGVTDVQVPAGHQWQRRGLVDVGGGGGTWSLYCTCWWYSLCNFQYRQQSEKYLLV